MAIILQQSSYNADEEFGRSPNETASQSLYFDRPFILNSVTVRFDSTSIDIVNDIEFKCEVRTAIGDDHLLDIRESVVDESPWYNDEDVPPGEFTFVLNSLSFDSGFYWFTIKSNQIINTEFLIATYEESGGEFLGRFIKIKSGTGFYRGDTSLMIKIDGTWGTSVGKYETRIHNEYTSTTIRDES